MNPADPFHIFDGRVLFGTHMDSAIRLQGSETGERLQVIYLIKKDGTQLAYVGPVLQEDELFSVENVEEGENPTDKRLGTRTTAHGPLRRRWLGQAR